MRYLFVITQEYEPRNPLERHFLEMMKNDHDRRIVQDRLAQYVGLNLAIEVLNEKFPGYRPIEVSSQSSYNNDRCIKVKNLFTATLYEIKEN